MPKRHVPLVERLKDMRVCVCVGAGGVGKTTVSAALALALAERGSRVAVVSIDPARRLAGALGLDELPGEPHRLDREMLASHGIEPKGELWAMMLDSKGTFDGLIERLAPDENTREEVLANRIYRELSSASAGSQEFTAASKLFDLERDGRFDTIVLDTPPSRNALDFLDAPDRLRRFLEGRALRLLSSGGTARGLVGRGTGAVFALLGRATGVNLIGELASFFGALRGLIDGFSERTRGMERLLRDPGTSFLIVTSPEHEPTREAAFFQRQLLAAGLPFGALVVNRIHQTGLEGHTHEHVRELLSTHLPQQMASRLSENLADFDVLVRRDHENVAKLSRQLSEAEPVLVPQLDGDVQDLAGLARIAERFLA